MDSTEQRNLSEFVAKDRPGGFGIDFHGGLSDPELYNLAMAAVYHVAHLRDHLRRWLRTAGKDAGWVDSAVRGSRALKVILDLANVDKHGGTDRGGGYTGKSPRVVKVTRSLAITATADNPEVAVVFRFDGTPPLVEGGGSGAGAKVVVSGEVVDRKGRPLGELRELLLAAIEVWERLAREHGLRV